MIVLAQVVLLGVGVLLVLIGQHYLMSPTQERAISKALDFDRE